MSLWTEEYRPATFDEIVGNENEIRKIRAEVESDDEMNHMLFLGPSGVGKTTTAGVIANTLYGGSDNTRFRELNASDERGIDTIRTKVKKLASRKTLSGGFSIVFLDEADSLTQDAQQALRRTMEKYSETCRFILSGNYESGFIEAIKSRCNVYRFDPIPDELAEDHLRWILRQENETVPDETISKLVQVYSGDLRTQIAELQSLTLLDEIDPDTIDVGGDYLQLLKYILEPSFPAAKKTATEENLKQLYNYLMQRDDLRGRVKAEISIVYAKYMWRLGRSPDKQIQLNALVAELIKQLKDELNNG